MVRTVVPTLSPDSTTRLPVSIELNCEDLEQRTTRLHLRLRCSSRLALDWVCLIASEQPKRAETPMRIVREVVDIVEALQKNTLNQLPVQPGILKIWPHLNILDLKISD